MIIIKQLSDLKIYPKPALTLGNFDGVHLGHRTILEQVSKQAVKLKGTAMAFSFASHPLALLNPPKAPPILTALEEKIALFNDIGIDVFICLPFTKQLACLSAEDFLKQIIHDIINPVEIIVGHDYRFGYKRRGTVELLEDMQNTYGYNLQVIQAIKRDDIILSSTLIRQRIINGDIKGANRLLGRFYSISAKVIHGNKKGKNLGYPTAALDKQPKLMPAVGVYAVWVQFKKKTYKGVLNLGYQPTYGLHSKKCELHIIDFCANLYNESLKVAFVCRIRPEIAFKNEGLLRAQIKKDIIKAEELLDSIVFPS